MCVQVTPNVNNQVILFGADRGRFRPLMAIFVFSDHCKRPYENFFFFLKKKRAQNLNLTLQKYFILFSRHVNNQVISYLMLIE